MNESDRNGDWIQTYMGIKFYPLDVREDDIIIEDIAHALSMKCRYNGHCNKFYSVAEHSIYVAQETEERWPDRKDLILWGLLHDAGEAYLPDTPRPIKKMGTGILLECENNILQVMAKKFKLPFPEPLEIKKIDNIILATESIQVMGKCISNWNLLLPENPVNRKIMFYQSKIVKQYFLAEFNRIMES